jgi:hypothetical protein
LEIQEAPVQLDHAALVVLKGLMALQERPEQQAAVDPWVRLEIRVKVATLEQVVTRAELAPSAKQE